MCESGVMSRSKFDLRAYRRRRGAHCSAAALVVCCLVLSNLPSIAATDPPQPVELAPYRVGVVLTCDRPLEAGDVSAWVRGVRESMRANAGEAWEVVDVRFVADSNQAEKWPSTAKDADKLFVCRLIREVGGPAKVVVEMRDRELGAAFVPSVSAMVREHNGRASATFWGIVATFGARGRVIGSAGGGALVVRVRGGALKSPMRELDALRKGAFGRLVREGDDGQAAVFGVVTDVEATQATVAVYSGASVGDWDAWSGDRRVWLVEQLAAGEGTEIRVSTSTLPVEGLLIAHRPLVEDGQIRRVGWTDHEGTCWVPRTSRPVWLAVQMAGVTIWQRPCWPGAEAVIEFDLGLDRDQAAAVRRLGRARLAVREGELEWAARRAQGLAKQKSGDDAGRRQLLQRAKKVAADMATEWKGALEKLKAQPMPAETAPVWREQCDDLLSRLARMRKAGDD